jgi:menaquinone-dependent protoporphyrinogen oxidase
MQVLVTYASKHGSTREVAERIASTIHSSGALVETRRVNQVDDVSGYDAVVIGSSIYYGLWMKEAIEFVSQNQLQLAQRMVWLFSVGPVGHLAKTEPPEVASPGQSVHVRGHALFSGALNPKQLSMLERAIVQGVKAEYGDFRDWSQIEVWAVDIAQQLSASGATSTCA